MAGPCKPKKSLVNSQLKALLVPKSNRETTPKAKAKTRGQVSSVPLARHDERDRSSPPCVLGHSLSGRFSAHALLHVTSKAEPELRFYVRAHPQIFREGISGISILSTIAAGAKLNNTREVDLLEVPEEAANLTKVEFVMLESYMSKRDLWHLHLAMMQHKGELLYRDFEYNFRQHIPRSKITELTSASGAVSCGRVSPNTDVVLRTASANVFVFIQLSSELLEYSLNGRPRWHALLGCLSELIDRSLRVYARSESGDGHYMRFVLFARRRCAPGESAAPCCTESRVAPQCSPPMKAKAPPPEFDVEGCMCLDDAGASPQGGYCDHYEIFWEGVARSLPPTEQFLRRILRLCTRLQEEYFDTGKRTAAHSPNECMMGVRAHDLVEASWGNVLECVNIAMDHYDQHHLDRSLRVTGQKIIVLTPGSGLIHAASRKLFELTHRRFTNAGPSSLKPFHMICLRQPACHEVPYVTWPARDEEDIESVSDDSAPGPAKASTLPHVPPWIDLTYHRDCGWSPNFSPEDWVRSSFQPLETWSNHDRLYVPKTAETEPLLDLQSWLNDEASDKSEGAVTPSTEEAFQDDCIFQFCEDSPSDHSNSAHSKWWSSDRKTGHTSFGARNLIHTSDELWQEIRRPVLRPYFRRTLELEAGEFNVGRYTDSYMLQPKRFDTPSLEVENVQTAIDLIGCRLEARASELCYAGEEGGATNDHDSEADLGTSGHDDPWQIQGNRIPKALQSCAVRASGGRVEWRMKGSDSGLTVYYRDGTNTEQSTIDLVHHYECRVRRHCVLKDMGGDELDEDFSWTICKRIFHMPLRPCWNSLDCIITGAKSMPPALPYPLNMPCRTAADDCTGWQLRSAIKQSLLMLLPIEGYSESHAACFGCAAGELADGFETGVCPFEVMEERALPSPVGAAVRADLLQRFANVIDAIDRLCFFSGMGRPEWPHPMNVELVEDSSRFIVGRNSCTVYVRNSSIQDAHRHSRDWFELFYDSLFSPPKPFMLAIQWMVCSSVHLVRFRESLKRIARDNGFFWARLPIGQLFPQPAPHWVWSEEKQTNFDRLAFHAPNVIQLDETMSTSQRRRLNAELLKAWLREDQGFLFVFSSTHEDCRVDKTYEVAPGHAREEERELYHRLKGWVLCHRSGTHLIALRANHIYWFDNRLAWVEYFDAEKTFCGLQESWRAFKAVTKGVIARVMASQ